MENSDYLAIDGRQLRILLTIQKAGSLSGAARILDMNQSTVSYWLDLLRERTGDPLFVRAGNGVEPTELAQSLFPEAEAALRHLEAMFEHPEYTPSLDTGTLKIAATAVERGVLLKPLLNQVFKCAPSLSVEILPPGSPHQLEEDLRQGNVDLGFAMQDGITSDGLLRRKVMSFMDVVYFDPNFPLTEGDLDEFCKRPHARVALGTDAGFAVDQRLAKLKRKRNIAVQVSDFDSALAVIPGTEIIITLPDLLDTPGLAQINPPWPTSSVDIAMFWHPRNKTSARHIYWRNFIANSPKITAHN